MCEVLIIDSAIKTSDAMKGNAMQNATVQDALSELLSSLGFEAMARDVKTETDKANLSRYARIIIKQSPEAKRSELARGFYALRLL